MSVYFKSMIKFLFVVMCSGSISLFSMDINYTASWRAHQNRIDFVLVANASQQWLSIGFTDEQFMVCVITNQSCNL